MGHFDLYGNSYRTQQEALNAEAAQCAEIDAGIAAKTAEEAYHNQQQSEYWLNQRISYLEERIKLIEEIIKRHNIENRVMCVGCGWVGWGMERKSIPDEEDIIFESAEVLVCPKCEHKEFYRNPNESEDQSGNKS